MLEGEHDNVLDPFDWHRARIPREALTYHDLNASDIIAGIPVVLIQELTAEVWELEPFKVAGLCKLCTPRSERSHYPRRRWGLPNVLAMRCGPLIVRSNAVDLRGRQ